MPTADTKRKRKTVQTLAPLIPLGIALLHGAVNPANSSTEHVRKASSGNASSSSVELSESPVPLLTAGHPVDWWFVFKFNSKSFPGCQGSSTRTCPFGGSVQAYKTFGQQFVYASSENPALQNGTDCVGDTTSQPLGATFGEVYDNSPYYVIWNDQFYDDPEISGCTQNCGSPWGHSKGMLAWNDQGDGFVLQVTTPSWPAAGSKEFPRQDDGNSLGCVEDNNVLVSQDFFALRLTKNDVTVVLKALQNSSVVTDPENSQIVNSGGPDDVQTLVKSLGKKSDSQTVVKSTLSNGVVLISKPSGLHVPPWQMVSALLDGVDLRAATWWANPAIYSTTATTPIACWDDSLGNPGSVEIATTGKWNGTSFGLKGGSGPDFNHAKIGVSTSSGQHYVIFGDLNQQGTVSGPNCNSSQNGRGGLFYVVDNVGLSDNIKNLIGGESAPTKPE